MINRIPFLIVGVMLDKMQNSMYNGADVDKAAIPYSAFKTIYGDKYLSRLIYRPEDMSKAETVKNEVYGVLSRKYK